MCTLKWSKQKDNELIAKFCGFQKTDLGWYDYEEILNDGFSNTYDTLIFHKDWNWLMSVVEYINNNTNYGLWILKDSTTVDKKSYPYSTVSEHSDDSLLNNTYHCIVKFIKYHNEKKEG